MKNLIKNTAMVSLLLLAGMSSSAQVISNFDMQTFESYKDTGYDQSLRPQFHFTSLKNWINDPNGMVWYAGEYHLFFQHNPKSTNWGNMTWGHAVSTDMVHWKQLQHAILPYGEGTIYSGTAVIDKNNSLGKQKGEEKTMVAIFTYAKEPFYQAAAYSTDKGRTFQLLNNGEAVVPNQGIDKTERDPKVFWHEASKKWVMVLWVQKAEKVGTAEEVHGKIRFFTSDNLTNWTLASELERNWAFECMDFVQLPVDGNRKNKKWLLYDASFDYEIGDFDGEKFTNDKKSYLGDFGPNFYAAQTFNNSPDNRTVMIGWMSDSGDIFQKAGMPFNCQMSFPNTLELKTTPDGIRLFRWPVKEIENLYVKSHVFKNVNSKQLSQQLAQVKADLIDLSIDFNTCDSLKMNVRGIIIDWKKGEFLYKNRKIPAPVIDGKVKLRVLLDRASLEFFANDGASVATFYAVPEPQNKSISISTNGNTIINHLIINELKSSWESIKN
jgi:sucrose-6-phosphate hydrolase SacC (GH32 family)